MTRALRDPLSAHRTVAVFGLGSAGAAAVKLLVALGKEVVASDAKAPAKPHPALPGVRYSYGANELGEATAVVLSPGLNPSWPENRDNPTLQPVWAKWAAGEVEVWSEIELAAACFDGPVLSIGGTDGKSTTAALCAHLLKGWGIDACLAGNSWLPFSHYLAEGLRPEVAVLEVSAFQLWPGHRFHAPVSILTNIAPDHLDHFEKEQDYIDAKREVFAHQGAGDTAVLFGDDTRLQGWRPALQTAGVKVLGYGLDGVPAGFDGAGQLSPEGQFAVKGVEASMGLPAVDDLMILGSHNHKNVLAAMLACGSLAIGRERATPEATRRALQTFGGLPHRVELIRKLRGVRYVNDSKATNVHASVAGLRSLAARLVVITGGVDKNLELDPILAELETRARHVVVIGQIADRFVAEATGRLGSMERAATMEEAVVKAAAAAQEGDVVLLSPACSSFDMFRGFEHRGDVFAAAVRALPEG